MLITSVYSPLRHLIKTIDYKYLIAKHDLRFIMGGDFNADNTYWKYRLNVPKEKELYTPIWKPDVKYWPTDSSKTADLIRYQVGKWI